MISFQFKTTLNPENVQHTCYQVLATLCTYLMCEGVTLGDAGISVLGSYSSNTIQGIAQETHASREKLWNRRSSERGGNDSIELSILYSQYAYVPTVRSVTSLLRNLNNAFTILYPGIPHSITLAHPELS